jgi:hypothetical protein
MSDNNIVTKICGAYPPGFTEKEILSNPNFIFSNDPEYSAVQLFDSQENTVFVNSFLECQHYVKGGWDFLPIQRNEEDFFDIFMYISITSIIFGVFVIKKMKRRTS